MLHSERSGVPMIHACTTCIEMNLTEMENIRSFAFSLLAGFTVFLPCLQVTPITSLNIIKSLVVCTEGSCYT
jgi:hypothetical protein